MAFAADIVPTETNQKYFAEGDAEHLFGKEILDYLSSVDFRSFNLETPLTQHEEEVFYPGPYMRADPETVHAISALNPSLITIGNNHILDQGSQGCLDTMKTLSDAGISFIGAGKCLDEAAEPFIIDTGEGTVGIYNCTEYEFAAASKNAPGGNPYDPLESFDAVRALKEKCGVVIVLYHGGKEFYRYPSPALQRICRKFAECGAGLVICQHTHCIGCAEEYAGAHIVYGQGNFVFDRKETEYKKTGLFVECSVENGRIKEVSYVPFVKAKECVRLAEKNISDTILAEMSQRSSRIMEEGFIESEYEKLAAEQFPVYLKKILGKKKWLRFMNKVTKGNYIKDYYSRKEALAFLNVIGTDNHAELFKAGLRGKAK